MQTAPTIQQSRIELTKGQSATVDDEDAEYLQEFSWHAWWNRATKSFYARRSFRKENGVFTTLQMSREIMGLEQGDPREVHHVNGNTLDNRRSNLKIVTVTEHKNEHRNDPRRNVSKYGVGVRRRPSGRFEARAQKSGRYHCLGTFDTPEEARRVRKDFLS